MQLLILVEDEQTTIIPRVDDELVYVIKTDKTARKVSLGVPNIPLVPIVPENMVLTKRPVLKPAPKPTRPIRTYVPEEEDEPGLVMNRPRWSIPEDDDQRAFLEVCGAKWFKARQKSKIKAIVKAISAGKILAGNAVYERVIDLIKDKTDISKNVPMVLPESWFLWRATQARQHRWSVDGFINALLDRDALMQHCKYQLRNQPPAPEPEPEPEDMGGWFGAAIRSES